MATMPKKVQEFMSDKVAWVSTASLDGVPNATPKGSVKVIDDEHIVFADLFSLKTRANLQENSHVAVTVVDAQSGQGYQIKGTAEMIADGPMFDQMADAIKKAPRAMPPLKYVVRITVNAVYNQSAGPDAGKQIV